MPWIRNSIEPWRPLTGDSIHSGTCQPAATKPFSALVTACTNCSAIVWGFGLAELELWLDERDRMGAVGDPNGLKLRDGVAQSEIGEVKGDDIDHLGDEICVQLAEVRRFKVHYPGILAKRAQQLSVPCIDRVNPADAGMEKNAGEASGGGTDVERHAIVDIDRE